MNVDGKKVIKVLEDIIETYDYVRTYDIDGFALQPARNLLVDLKAAREKAHNDLAMKCLEIDRK